MDLRIIRDKRGISILQDAIIFCLTVSIAAAVLAPVFVNNLSLEVYKEKEMEEKANEILYTLLACRVNEFEYSLDEYFVKFIGIEEDNIVASFLRNFFRKNSLHLTYGELITACVASQFKYENFQGNILTIGFTNELKKEIKKFLDELLQDYNYNFTVIWRPITFIPFGGGIIIGDPLPNENVYTAKTAITLPPSFITSLGLDIEKLKVDLEGKLYSSNASEEIADYIIGIADIMIERMLDYIAVDNEELVEKYIGIFDEATDGMIKGKINEIIPSLTDIEIKIDEFAVNIKPEIEKNIEEMEKNDMVKLIMKQFNFCTAEVTLSIWR